MKKSINKTTVIIVLVLFLVLSVGYALFSDTITIEGTATAQGNFDIEATCYTTIPDELKKSLDADTINDIESNPDNGFNKENCVVSDDKVTYSVGLEYPGARKWYAIEFKNIGTIDAKLPETVFANFETDIVKTYNSETKELVSTVEGSNHFFNDEIVVQWQKDDKNYIDLSNLTDEDMTYIFDTSDESNVYYLVRTGASMYLITYANWPTGDSYSEDGVYYEATQTIEFPFEQYNG